MTSLRLSLSMTSPNVPVCLSLCRFGPPLILRVWRDLNHSQFQSVVLKALMKYLREGVRLVDVSVGGRREGGGGEGGGECVEV